MATTGSHFSEEINWDTKKEKMPSFMPAVKLVLEIFFIAGFVFLVVFQPLYRQYVRSGNWKEISSEFDMQLDSHLMYPEMKGQVGGHSILFQNSVNWIRDTSTSSDSDPTPAPPPTP